MKYDLIIIGAGPAGITAAIYAARKKINFLVIAKEIGGQVVNNLLVENYTGYQEISGLDLVSKFEEHLNDFKFDLIMAEVSSVKKNIFFKVKENDNIHEAKSVLICTGAVPRLLGVKGESEYRNRGLSYCSTCDGPLFADKDVAIIGGGYAALATALQMEKIAKKIFIINSAKKLVADDMLIGKVQKSKKIKLFNDSQVMEIKASKLVQGLEIMSKGAKKDIKVQGIFINIGYMPATEFIGSTVTLNDNKEIIVDNNFAASVEGIFAAGDCTDTKYKQIVVAAGQGASALLSVNNYLLKRND